MSGDRDASIAAGAPGAAATADLVSGHQVVAGLGHTLRSPLTGLLGACDLLLSEAAGPLTERQAHYVRRVREAAEREMELVTNVVELARCDLGWNDPLPQPIDAGGVVRAVVARLAGAAERRSVHVECTIAEPRNPLVMDEHHLERIVFNLLSNAIRVSEVGGTVSIVVGREGDPPTLTLAVTDCGPGVPDELRPHVFEDFPPPTEPTPWAERRSGVGLALCRRLVHLHGGRIRVEGVDGPSVGSRFVVELPQ